MLPLLLLVPLLRWLAGSRLCARRWAAEAAGAAAAALCLYGAYVAAMIFWT
jgi:hypothetical protein